MKRVLFLACALLAGTVSAQNIKVGGDLLGGLTIPSVGDDVGGDGVMGWNLHVGPIAQYGFNEKFALEGGLAFGMQSYGVDFDGEEATIKPMALEFRIAPVFNINEKSFVSLGYVWSMPLGGTIEEGEDSDIVWAPSDGTDLKENEVPMLSSHLLTIGGGYSITPELSIVGNVNLDFLGTFPEYKNGDLDGRADGAMQIKPTQISVGVRYALGL